MCEQLEKLTVEQRWRLLSYEWPRLPVKVQAILVSLAQCFTEGMMVNAESPATAETLPDHDGD